MLTRLLNEVGVTLSLVVLILPAWWAQGTAKLAREAGVVSSSLKFLDIISKVWTVSVGLLFTALIVLGSLTYMSTATSSPATDLTGLLLVGTMCVLSLASVVLAIHIRVAAVSQELEIPLMPPMDFFGSHKK